MRDRKKQEIRKLVARYKQLLFLNDYHVYTRFRPASEDKELKDAYAVVRIDEDRKCIYIKLNSYEFNRMKIRYIKQFILHELVHVFFGELGCVLNEALAKADEKGVSSRTINRLRRNYDSVEHKKLNRLIRILLEMDRTKDANESLKERIAQLKHKK